MSVRIVKVTSAAPGSPGSIGLPVPPVVAGLDEPQPAKATTPKTDQKLN